jgi:YfiH family protein
MTSFTRNESGYYVMKGSPGGFLAGCTGRRINSIDYSEARESVRLHEKLMLQDITGLEPKDILFLDQVHGRDVLAIEERAAISTHSAGTGDAMVTPLADLCLVIRTADCVPVLAMDYERKIIGAAHSGWKGTMMGISGAMISLMRRRYGCRVENMRAFILPSIGPESYEVNRDVADFFPEETILRGEKLYVDLWAGIMKSLSAAGMPEENIFNTGICNRRNTEEFFSHRFGDSGRNLNFILFRG